MNNNNIRAEFVHKVYKWLATNIRKYDLDIDYGNIEDIEGSVIFACNHSNSHDFYTIQEVFKNNVNIFASYEGLNTMTVLIFKLIDTVLIYRDDKKSCKDGYNKLVDNVKRGNNIIMYPEATWNIHPSKPMLPMKLGVVKLAQETGRPIVPVIFEYVENNKYCNEEMETIDKCVVRFGDPIYVKNGDNLIEKLSDLRDAMATIRWYIWEGQGLYKREDLDVGVFINHDTLKCDNGMFNFKYDWASEEKYILDSNNYIYSNYPINKVIYDDNKKQVLKKIK